MTSHPLWTANLHILEPRKPLPPQTTSFLAAGGAIRSASGAMSREGQSGDESGMKRPMKLTLVTRIVLKMPLVRESCLYSKPFTFSCVVGSPRGYESWPDIIAITCFDASIRRI